jgi:hypothetical protein
MDGQLRGNRIDRFVSGLDYQKSVIFRHEILQLKGRFCGEGVSRNSILAGRDNSRNCLNRPSY